MDTLPTGQLCAISFGGVSIWLFIVAILLICCSAYFSASEMAFTTVNQTRLRGLADNKVKGARKAVYITEHYDKTLSSILIGNNLVNIGTTTICAYIFSTLITNPTLANVLNTVIMTLIILTFGEILPKSMVKVEPLSFALKTSGIMFVIIKVLTPISWLFLKIQLLATRKAKETGATAPTVTEGELESIIDTMEEEGVLDKDNAEIMQSVLDLEERTAYDIMTPRVDISAISIGVSVKNAQDKFVETMFSRLPVYDGTIDKIVGVLNQKDLFKAMVDGKVVDIKSVMTKPLYINENMRVDDVIRLMQKTKKHMAVVLDEYGGTSGIVCMEDAIEEVVGEIYDEHDEVAPSDILNKKNDNEFVVDSEMELQDLFDTLEIEHLPETDYTSVGGFLFGLSEELPVQDKVITYKTIDERVVDGLYVSVPVELQFTLSKVEDNRIKEVTVKMLDIAPASDDDKKED